MDGKSIPPYGPGTTREAIEAEFKLTENALLVSADSPVTRQYISRGYKLSQEFNKECMHYLKTGLVFLDYPGIRCFTHQIVQAVQNLGEWYSPNDFGRFSYNRDCLGIWHMHDNQSIEIRYNPLVLFRVEKTTKSPGDLLFFKKLNNYFNLLENFLKAHMYAIQTTALAHYNKDVPVRINRNEYILKIHVRNAFINQPFTSLQDLFGRVNLLLYMDGFNYKIARTKQRKIFKPFQFSALWNNEPRAVYADQIKVPHNVFLTEQTSPYAICIQFCML